MTQESDLRFRYHPNLLDKILAATLLYGLPPVGLIAELQKNGELFEKIGRGEITDPTQIEEIKEREKVLREQLAQGYRK